ncbi:MAG: phosphoglycerate dehydrogenase, partial [Candidatus Omnitrophica bacterium]|nr:phosphoglycerate dehydrogenase [Candidatus Omnitrophota bacterium]
LDNVDLKAATKKGVVAMNTPAGNTTSTAEHTMSMILALTRNIPQACASMKTGKWERSKFNGMELHGKTLGVVGLGRIGSTVSGMAKAFGMKVIAFDPYISREIAEKKGIEVVEFETLLKTSDYITIHIPKSDGTQYLISEKEIALMKPSVRLINCARGGIIDEAALARALKEKRVAGCALDVFEQEPPSPDSPLFQLDNCVTTPHLGASTSEAQVNVAIEIAQTVRDALLGRGIINAANFPSVSAEEYKMLEPYIDLAQKMGLFAGQLVSGRVSGIKITYSGAITKYKVAPATMAFVYGALFPILGETVNPINALDLANERGINIEEIQSHKEEEFVNLVNAEIVTDKEKFAVWGTLSGNNQPRIVKVNNVYVESKPSGHMIFINNNDKPGIVGAVGTILAEDNINIAGITFGRETPGGLAVSVVNIDGKASEKTIEKIRRTKDVLFVKLIKI